jgi:tetratricopeptide (TPR) repeat protein
METSAALNQGWDLLFGGRFRDSLVPFSQAAGDFRSAAEALYGMGVAQLSLNEDVHAEAALWDSLQRAPLNPEAVFYLGLIAERRGRRQEAISRYHETLSMAAGHANALNRLSVLRAGSTMRPSLVPLPAARPAPPAVWTRPAARPIGPDPGDRSDAEETARLLEGLRLTARPRALAYLVSFDSEVFAPLPVNPLTAALLALFWLGLFLLRRELPFFGNLLLLLEIAFGAAVVLEVLGLVVTAVRATRLRVSISGGEVRVTGDIVPPRVARSVNLARVDSVELRRTGLQAWTGDGTLVLRSREGALLLCGVARGSRLTHLYRQLLELVERLHGW